MLISKPIYFASLLVLTLLSTAAAQESANTATQISSLTITANASGDRVRVTAPSSVMQMRLEVYAGTGAKVFDEELRGGNVFDWHLQDGQAARMPAGDYVCVVTAKTISGKLTQKVGAVTVAENSASVRAGDTQQFTSSQAQAIGPVEANSSWTIVAEGENKTTTVIANTGSEGQMIRGRGALTFRLGDFFSGKDEEQMRLTEEGNLGIGTATPQAKLDVAGVIRAERFLIAKPGTSGSDKTTSANAATDASNSLQPLTGGSGITGKLTKWIDGPAGTLGDSVITESPTGNIGVGTANPQAALHVRAGLNRNIWFRDAGPTQKAQIMSVADDNGTINTLSLDAAPLILNSQSSGNVGIGTVSPQGKLHVRAGLNRNIWFRDAGPTQKAQIMSVADDNGTINTLSLDAAPLILNSQSGGNVGIGTTSPQQNLSVNGAMNVDQANLNGGSFGPGISFGSGSGEGIASNRICGVACIINPANNRNLFGLDFYTNFLNRMSITNGGNVGIGTNNPGAPLDVQVAAGQSLQFRQDSGLVPGINVKTTGGNAGIMRLRNSIEVWPSDDGTRAGKVSVWSTAPSPTISLDGQTGNLSATGDASFRNMPGIQFSQGPNANTLINAGESVAVDSLTINAPASGFVFVSADVEASTEHGGNHTFDFTLLKDGTNIVNSKSQTRTNTSNVLVINGEVPIHLSWVFPVNAGSFQLNTSLYYDNYCDCGASATVYSHNLTAIYLPKQY